MFTSDHRIRVRYGETDKMQVVYHAHYATYMEVGRTEAIRGIGITYREMEEAGIEMPVTELSIRYLRPARYDDLLTVRTQLRSLPERHRIEFHQDILNERGKLVASGRVTLFFLDAITKKRASMPGQWLDRLRAHFPPQEGAGGGEP